MASNASRGAAAKARTRKWLAAQGYAVFDMEVVKWLCPPGRERIPVKRDQLGSDLGAVNAQETIFVQVKSGKSALGGTFPAARREFQKFTFPIATRQLVIAWAPRARTPRVVDCSREPF